MTDTVRRHAKPLRESAELWTARFSVEVGVQLCAIKVILIEFSPFAPGDRQSRHQQPAPVAVVSGRAASGCDWMRVDEKPTGNHL